MWKKILAPLFVVMAAFVFTQQAAAAAEFKEGVHYQVKTDKLTPKKEIREFFSFWCGHCFHLQKDFASIKAAFPKAAFELNPVSMMGGNMGPESQFGLVIAQNLGLEEIYVKELFKSMHEDGNIPRTHADMVAFANKIGIPSNKFEQEYKSFIVAGKVSRMDKWAEQAGIEAVPEILVNGKYLVTMESVDDVEGLKQIIAYLLDKDNVPDAK